MKKLRIKSLYKILILLIINIIFNNLVILIISILLLLTKNLKHNILILILLIFTFYINNNHNDFIKAGFVDLKTDNYVIVNKIIYKTKIYTDSLEVGDIVTTSNSYFNDKESELKNNIVYTSKSYKKMSSNYIKNTVYKFIDKKSNSNIYKNIFYNIYDEDLNEQYNNISFGLTFYYFILLIFRNNRKFGMTLVTIYSLIFGFQTKFILFLIDFILSYFDLDKIENILFKIFSICLINKYLLINYSFLLGIIISLFTIFDNKNNLIYIGIIQSLLFGEVKIFNVLFYKAYIYEKISIFIFGLLSLIFNCFEKPFLKYFDVLNNIFSVLSYSIRGKFGIICIVLYLITVNIFNIKKHLYRYFVFILILLIPFSSYISHVNFIDVGQGDSILIVDSSTHKNVLIDTGSKYNYSKLKKNLFYEGIYKIDYLIITHDDNDHNGNIDNLKSDFSIGEVIKEGRDFNNGKLFFNYLELEQTDNDNDNSLVYLLNIDKYRILFTGDISSNIENSIIFDHNLNDIDILKVSHHGSKTATSDYFVGSLKPEFAIISTSGQYNHPHKEVIDTLNKFQVETFITKNDGSIKFYFTKLLDFIVTDKFRFDIIIK